MINILIHISTVRRFIPCLEKRVVRVFRDRIHLPMAIVMIFHNAAANHKLAPSEWHVERCGKSASIRTEMCTLRCTSQPGQSPTCSIDRCLSVYPSRCPAWNHGDGSRGKDRVRIKSSSADLPVTDTDKTDKTPAVVQECGIASRVWGSTLSLSEPHLQWFRERHDRRSGLQSTCFCRAIRPEGPDSWGRALHWYPKSPAA